MDERKEFLQRTNVSRETEAKFVRYAEMLGEWQGKFNLVAPSTLPHVWTRHFLDSAQLYPLLPEEVKTLADIGSGAGFPGMVLAILGVPEVHLVESIGKKAGFLREVARELELPVIVHQERAEAIKNLKVDVVTARAVMALKDLLGLTHRFFRTDTIGLFPKGENAAEELTDAARCWNMRVEKIPSLSNSHTGKPPGIILKVSEVRFVRPSPRKPVRKG